MCPLWLTGQFLQGQVLSGAAASSFLIPVLVDSHIWCSSLLQSIGMGIACRIKALLKKEGGSWALQVVDLLIMARIFFDIGGAV